MSPHPPNGIPVLYLVGIFRVFDKIFSLRGFYFIFLDVYIESDVFCHRLCICQGCDSLLGARKSMFGSRLLTGVIYCSLSAVSVRIN